MGLFDKVKSIVPDNLADVAQTVGGIAETVGSIVTAKSKSESCSVSKNDTKTSSLPEKSSSEWSDGLEKMVKMALEDGNIGDREMEILTKRAMKEGIDPDDFEYTLRMRIRQQSRNLEMIRNQNPVVALSKAFSMLEQYAKAPQALDSTALTQAMAIIPGVGQVAVVGGLLSEFIEKPSNLNTLKAEAIRRFNLPDNPQNLCEFIQYASSQYEEECQHAAASNVKKFLSSALFGSDLDLRPIWEHKIEDACEMANQKYIGEPELMAAVRKYKPTITKKLQKGLISLPELTTLPAPSDDEDLLGVIEYLYSMKNDERYWEMVKPVHRRLYSDAERRFETRPDLKNRLSLYKIKKFGLF